jgi:hypothetical protein
MYTTYEHIREGFEAPLCAIVLPIGKGCHSYNHLSNASFSKRSRFLKMLQPVCI